MPTANAQPIGTFRWQLHPYCNIVTLNVAQQGAVYALDGVDDQCGAGQRASVSGAAFPNPDGSIGIGVTTVLAPGGAGARGCADHAGDAERPLARQRGEQRHVRVHARAWRARAGAAARLEWRATGEHYADATGPDAAAAMPPPGAFSLAADGRLQARDPGISPLDLNLLWLPAAAVFRAGVFNSGAVKGAYSWAGGSHTVASGAASFAIGATTRASGNYSVAMGNQTYACGDYSVALGRHASASALPECGGTPFAHSFVFGDGSAFTTLVGQRQFVVRASGGVSFWSSSGTAGCHLNAGAGAWSCASDRALKERFEPLDGEEVLHKVAGMPVDTWSFKTEPGVRHAGPVAQDFRAAFGLGTDDTTIGYTDINGINMRAIQALEARTRELQDAVRQRDQRIGDLERRLGDLEERLRGLRP